MARSWNGRSIPLWPRSPVRLDEAERAGRITDVAELLRLQAEPVRLQHWIGETKQRKAAMPPARCMIQRITPRLNPRTGRAALAERP